MAQMTQEDEAAFKEIMQVLEAEPTEAPTANPLVSNNIPAQREKLSILVSTGKSKEKKPSGCSSRTSR